MSAIPFKQFLRKYGITLFSLSTASNVPGVVLEKRNKGYFQEGHLSDIPALAKINFNYAVREANLIYENVDRTLSISGKSSLNEFGLKVKGGLSKAKSVHFALSGVQAGEFTDTSKLALVPELLDLRKKSKSSWKSIKNNWIADKVFYASSFSVSFDVDGDVDLSAELDKKIEVSAGAGFNWTSKRSLQISNSVAVPFGFTGWQV